jgi:uncharacterized membrane protein YkvA (DUF1232 family)
MTQRVSRTWPPLQLGLRSLQLLRHLPDFVRLYWRLLRDRRVSIWPKAFLILSALYVVSPVDLIPDVIPFMGQLDDIVIVIAACRLFMYMCRPEVVREHVQQIDAGK